MTTENCRVIPEPIEAPQERDADYYTHAALRFQSRAEKWRVEGRADDAEAMLQVVTAFLEKAADLRRGRSALDDVR